MHRKKLALLLGCVMVAGGAAASDRMESEVFREKTQGYTSYRIPSIAVTKSGHLIAIAEGRRNSRSDTGDIDILVKRSTDSGRTWSDFTVIADHGTDTIGNPTILSDRKSGRLILLLTGNPGNADMKEIVAGEAARTVWITTSSDEGVTWAKPREITKEVTRPGWTWYATGPGNGIQLQGGRMVVPCNHRKDGSPTPYSHVIYSDDAGETWKIGGIAGANTNESQVVELGNGNLLLNMRSFEGKNRRAWSVSRDKGMTWTAPRLDEALVEPGRNGCQGSIIGLTGMRSNRILFSNPAAETRTRMTVRLSEDGGRTWKRSRLLYEGPSAYSALVALPDGSIGCLYERGEGDSPYTTISFARFSSDWLAGR